MKKLELLLLFVLLSLFSFGQDVGLLDGKALFGDMEARHIGPALMSGRVSDIEGHPKDPSVIYIGTAGGGVWKSMDGGLFFNPVFDKHCQSIGCVSVDPNRPDEVIWVGTGEVWTRNSTSVGDGIYKSTDGGQTWKNMGLKKSDRISSIQIHPENSDVVFVGVQGALWGPSEERGVYKTTDGGQTWEKILGVDENTGCSELIMDKNNPNVMYAAFWEHRRTAWSFNSGGEKSALYKTTNGGKTWKKIHSGFPKGKLGRIAIAIAPSNSNILYAVVESEDKKKSGMYRSDDAGKTWNHLNADFNLTVRPFYFSRIVVHPKNPDIVAKAGLFGVLSRDGGKSFRQMGQMHADIHDYWFDVADTNKIFVATDGGLYYSFNLGNTLEMVNNLPISQFYHVSVDHQEPYNVYGGLQDNGSWYGPSSSPGGIEARDWETIGFGDGFRVYPHPKNPKITYSEMQGAEMVWKYDSEARQSKNIRPLRGKDDPKLRFNWNAAITTSVHHPDRVYMGSQFLHISNDMGNTWKKISPDLTTNDPEKLNQENSGGLSKDNSGAENHCTIFTIAESPLDERVIWVGTDDGNVQITKDGGKTWTNVVKNIPDLPKNTWCYHIEASHFDKGTAYAVFDGHTKNDKTTYCYKTTDFGKTWKSIVTADVYGFARSFQEDNVNPNLLFLGTEFGLYISLNGGKKWVKFENNMPAVAIHYLDLQKETGDLVMATHGRGVIILDDISPLRKLTPEVLQSDKLVFLGKKTFVMPEETSFGGTSTPTQFVGDNPPRSAKIVYYLPKRHIFGKMKVKVYDEEGNFMTLLEGGKKKGLNFVYWSFHKMMPKIASGATFARGGFVAPSVPAGMYTVRIEKGKDVFETKIETKYPEKSVFTLEERAKQQEIAGKLYKMVEDFAYLVYRLDTYVSHAKMTANKHPEYKEPIEKMIKELEAFKKEIVKQGDNYVGGGEDKLREKMAEIYGEVTGYLGAPTQNQMDNIALIEKEFEEVKKKLKEIEQGEFKKYLDLLKRLNIPYPKLKTYEEFVDKTK